MSLLPIADTPLWSGRGGLRLAESALDGPIAKTCRSVSHPVHASKKGPRPAPAGSTAVSKVGSRAH